MSQVSERAARAGYDLTGVVRRIDLRVLEEALQSRTLLYDRAGEEILLRSMDADRSMLPEGQDGDDMDIDDMDDDEDECDENEELADESNVESCSGGCCWAAWAFTAGCFWPAWTWPPPS